MNKEHIEEKLWEYIDGLSTEEDKTSINRLLHADPEWKLKYNELMELNRMLDMSELEQPSMRFAQNVMEEIVKQHIAPATKTYINKKIIYGIGGFLLTMLLGLIIYFIANLQLQQGSASSSFSEGMGRMNWSNLLNSGYTNIFLLTTLVLGLMLLDRYLDIKKEELKNKKA
jgi:hypothetical protein